MKLKGKRIGYVLTGSFCTFSKTIPVIKELVKNGAEVIPIMSYNSYNLDTKFGKAQDFIKEIEENTVKSIVKKEISRISIVGTGIVRNIELIK